MSVGPGPQPRGGMRARIRRGRARSYLVRRVTVARRFRVSPSPAAGAQHTPGSGIKIDPFRGSREQNRSLSGIEGSKTFPQAASWDGFGPLCPLARNRQDESGQQPPKMFTTRPYFEGLLGPDPGKISFHSDKSLLVTIQKASPGRMVVLCEGRRGEGCFQ